MATADELCGSAPPSSTGASGASPERLWAWGALCVLLALALALRLWGIKQGLPYAYNSDESAHFLARAIGMFGHSLNPEYFANPPALTYLLHMLLAVWYGSGAAVGHAYATHPTEVWVLARATVAVLGTLAVWLLYAAGSRLFNRGVGLAAAALEAVAFLPVFYAHLALNDVPTLVPATLCLLGAAGVLRRGRMLDYLLGGIGLGLGCATKYTAGIMLAPLVAAILCQYAASPRGTGRRVLIGTLVAGASALAAFAAANPYALLDFHAFHAGIVHQSTLSSEAQGKLGAPKESGIFYYLWSFTWGVGWVPSLAAVGGALTVWFTDRRVGWLLVPALLAYLAFMGFQGRYFGRWLMPVIPIVCLLAAHFALTVTATVVNLLGGRGPRRVLRVALPVLALAALCWQGALYSIHSDLVLSRPYTANLARAWMTAHIPAGTPIVLEPIAPESWLAASPQRIHETSSGEIWSKYPSLRSLLGPGGALLEVEDSYLVSIEDYERTLTPALIGYYERQGYCWVITGSTQFGRAQADPQAVAHAIAYYRALRQRAQLVYHISPYSPGRGPVAFNFDWTFDFYPLAYRLPGPEINIYRLREGRCAGRGPTVSPAQTRAILRHTR